MHSLAQRPQPLALPYPTGPALPCSASGRNACAPSSPACPSFIRPHVQPSRSTGKDAEDPTLTALFQQHGLPYKLVANAERDGAASVQIGEEVYSPEELVVGGVAWRGGAGRGGAGRGGAGRGRAWRGGAGWGEAGRDGAGRGGVLKGRSGAARGAGGVILGRAYTNSRKAPRRRKAGKAKDAALRSGCSLSCGLGCRCTPAGRGDGRGSL